MILQDVWHVALGFSTGMPIEVEPVQEHLSTDTGLLLFRQFDDELEVDARICRSIGRHSNRPDAFGFGDGSKSRVRHYRRL